MVDCGGQRLFVPATPTDPFLYKELPLLHHRDHLLLPINRRNDTRTLRLFRLVEEKESDALLVEEGDLEEKRRRSEGETEDEDLWEDAEEELEAQRMKKE